MPQVHYDPTNERYGAWVSGVFTALPFGVGEKTITLTGNQDNLDIDNAAFVRLNNASDITIRGILAGKSGQLVSFVSIGAGHAYFAHQNTNSTAANRLINSATSGNTPLAAGVGAAVYQYDGTTARWRLVAHTQGAWINVAYASGNFVGSASMTWTVDAGDVQTQKYLLIGRLLYYNINLQNTAVGGTPDIELRVTIPNGYTVDGEVFSSARVRDNGAAAVVAMVNIPDGVTYVGFRSTIVGSTNWTASAGSTTMAVLNPLTFQVD